jgi:ABC-type protease/lipase transport system fused ATPase/permease subunit
LLRSAPDRDGGQMQGLRALHKQRAFLSSPMMLLLFDVPLTPLFFAVVGLINPGLGAIALFAGISALSAALFKHTLTSRVVRIAAPVAIVGWGVHLMLAGALTVGMMVAASIIAGRALRTLADASEGREYVVQAWAEYVRVCAALESGQLSNTDGVLRPAPVTEPRATTLHAFRNSAPKRRHIAISC